MAQCDVNRAGFLRLVYDVGVREHEREGIGTYKEKKLHLILKRYFDSDPSHHEVPLAGYIADICSDDGVTEIQTSGFASMNDKLEAFLAIGRVTVVYPVAQRKWVCWIDPDTGEFSAKNRSPKKGTALDAVPEMIYIRRYLRHPNLRIRVVLLEIDEYRLLDGKRSLSRKRGSHRFERMPVDLFEIYEYHTAEDFRAQLPPLPTPFTAADFAKAAKMRGRKISAALKVLEEVGVICRTGKRGNAVLYTICADTDENFHGDY